MYELALFTLDLAQNALSAGARLVKVWIIDDARRNRRDIIVADNGCGMPPEIVQRALDPFMTTKTNRRRKIGLGLPFFLQLVESCGGRLRLVSRPGCGTVIHGWYVHDHVDQPPLGDMAATFEMLIAGNPAVDFRFTCARDDERLVVDTRPVRAVLGDAATALWQTRDVRAWFAAELAPVNRLLHD